MSKLSASQRELPTLSEHILDQVACGARGKVTLVFDGHCPGCAHRLDREGICAKCDLKWQATTHDDGRMFVKGSTRLEAGGGSEIVWNVLPPPSSTQ